MASSHSSHRVTAGCWQLYALAALALWYGSRCRSRAKPHGLRPSWSAMAFYVTVRLGVTTGCVTVLARLLRSFCCMTPARCRGVGAGGGGSGAWKHARPWPVGQVRWARFRGSVEGG